MKAIQLHTFGGNDVLGYEEVSEPSLKLGDVLVQTHAAGINPIDWKTCSGGGAAPFIGELPFIPGWEFSGTVMACGADVADYQTADRVCGFIHFPARAGCFAEQIAAPAASLARVPENVDMNVAAALPLAGLTAWQALFEGANLQPKQRILILAAAGGVGHLAVQLAAHKNATVIGTASAPKHAYLRELGCHEVIDYQAANVADVIDPVDVILDCVGGQHAINALPALKADGVMVTLPTVTKDEVIAAGEAADRKVLSMRAVPNAEQLAQMLNLAASGDLVLSVAAEYKPEQLGEAFDQIASGRTQGKLVLRFK